MAQIYETSFKKGHNMKRILPIIAMAMMTMNTLAQTPVYDKSRQRQWQAMELGEIDFTPKEYYRIFHGEPEALNLWLGDRYAVYDHNWHWAGLHSGFRWDFNSEKSKAVNLAPKRMAALAEFYLIDKLYEEMMDTLSHQMQRELSRAADCEIDKYFEAYKPSFQSYESSICDLMARYVEYSTPTYCGPPDDFHEMDNMVDELRVLRETVSNTHNAYMESMLKEEVYADVLERYKKLNKKLFWRVFVLEGKKQH